MARLIIFGATGWLGRRVLRQTLAAGHQVTAFVRTPSRLPPETRTRVRIHTGDLAGSVPVGRMPQWTAKPREVIP